MWWRVCVCVRFSFCLYIVFVIHVFHIGNTATETAVAVAATASRQAAEHGQGYSHSAIFIKTSSPIAVCSSIVHNSSGLKENVHVRNSWESRV